MDYLGILEMQLRLDTSVESFSTLLAFARGLQKFWPCFPRQCILRIRLFAL